MDLTRTASLTATRFGPTATFYRGNSRAQARRRLPGRADTKSLSYFSGGQRVTGTTITGRSTTSTISSRRAVTDLTPVGTTPSTAITRDFGAYVQDSWKAAPNLTINVGPALRPGMDPSTTLGETVIPDHRVAAARRRRVGPPAGRHVEGLRLRRAILLRVCRRTSRSASTERAASVYDLQLRSTPSIVQDPNVIGHADALTVGSTFGEPVDAGLKGISQDEFTLGVEKTFGRHAVVGAQGQPTAVCRTRSRTAATSTPAAPESSDSQLRDHESGLERPIARGDFHYCTGLDDDSATATTTSRCPARPRYPRPSASTGGSSSSRASPSPTSLWLQASYVYSSLRGNYDGEVSEGFHGQTDPGINADFDYPQLLHNAYGRLYLDRPHRCASTATTSRRSASRSASRRGCARARRSTSTATSTAATGRSIQLVPKGYAGRLPTEWECEPDARISDPRSVP